MKKPPCKCYQHLQGATPPKDSKNGGYLYSTGIRRNVDLDNEFIPGGSGKTKVKNPKQKKPKKKHGLLKILLISFGIVFAMGIFSGIMSSIESESESSRKKTSSSTSASEKKTSSSSQNKESEKQNDMGIGDIAYVGDLEIGLSYIKRSNTHTTAMGTNSDVAAGDEVIYAFFEVHNAGEEMQRLNYLLSEINAAYHEASQRLGLSDSTMQVLYVVCNYGESCLLSEICKLSGTSKQTINSALRKLEGEGVIRLEPLAGKRKKVCLTEKGKTIANETVARLIEIENTIFDSWTNQE